MSISSEFDYERASGGEAFKLLSQSNGKTVEAVRDEQGIFVRRRYSQSGILIIERGCNRSFGEAWTAYNEMLAGAGVVTIESELFRDSSGDNPIIISEYIDDTERGDVTQLPLDSRMSAISNLGKLLTSSDWFLPATEGFQADGFIAKDDMVMLLDVDPYLRQRNQGLGSISKLETVRAIMKNFILKAASIADVWSLNEDERVHLASSFIGSIDGIIETDSEIPLSKEFSVLHAVANGFTYRDSHSALLK